MLPYHATKNRITFQVQSHTQKTFFELYHIAAKSKAKAKSNCLRHTLFYIEGSRQANMHIDASSKHMTKNNTPSHTPIRN